MEHDSLEIVPLLWLGGWLVAIVAVFWAALRLPLDIGYGSWRGRLYVAGIVLAAVGVCALANVALHLHDGHVDLLLCKVLEGHDGGDFEERRRERFKKRTVRLHPFHDRFLRHHLAVHPDTLAKIQQMRAGVQPHPIASLLKDARQRVGAAALA